MNRLVLPAGPSVSELSEATTPPLFSPGTLGFALVAERDGRGHVEFLAGVPRWVTGPARFPMLAEVSL